MKKSVSEIAFRVVFALLALLYFAAVLWIALNKNGIRVETSVVMLRPFNIASEFFRGERSLKSLAVNYIGNIGLFLPLGLLLPAALKKMGLASAVIAGFALSVAVELLQYVTSSGYADVDDVLMNTIGTLIGAVVYFYLLGGRKKTALSYALTLCAVVVLFVAAFVVAWDVRPELLPRAAVINGGRIAGRQIDGYDVELKSYKMSHGEVFVCKGTAKGNDGAAIKDVPGSYYISDSAVMAIHDVQNGKDVYDVVGIDEMIAEASKADKPLVRIWLDGDGRAVMILMEKE